MHEMINYPSTKKAYSFSLREKARMRGKKIKQLSDSIPSPQPFYARAAGYARCTQKPGINTQKPGIKEREFTGQQ
jgi:hypothetical protein